MEKSKFYQEARTDLSGPLAGIKVVETTTTWAGPMCGCMLADLGADVIKVELPGGEVARHVVPFLPGTNPPISFMHASVNRNKRSMTLDLRQPEGRDLFLRLAARADVIVENFRPGVMHRWGIGFDEVRKVKADIVYVSISGYGHFGPDRSRAGYDVLSQARSGFLSLNGERDGSPVRAPTYFGDDLGGLHGAIAALAALRHRDRTGEGQHVDVALLDSVLFQSNGFLMLAAMGVKLERLGNEFPFAVPANAYRCRDGYVMIVILVDAHWRATARLIGRPELAHHPDYETVAARVAHRAELNEMMGQWFAQHTVDEAIKRFAAEGLSIAPVQTYAEASRDPQVLARDMLQPTPQEDGTIAPLTGPAAKFSRTPTRVRTGAPALGAHTEEILRELGIDDSELPRLREAKIV
jgi:formyl-CoA transferase